jgi:hypothetical protein
VLEAEQVEHTDVITHSYGSLIFEAMFHEAQKRGEHFFDEARVIMLSPAGFNKEKLASLGIRFVTEFAGESKVPKDFTDKDKPEMLKAGQKNATTNVLRTIREVKSLTKRELDYPTLLAASKLGKITVLSYAADKLYSDNILYPGMAKAVESGIAWAVPIADDKYKYEGIKPIASHNDEQFNPARVAATVAELLK